MAYSDDGRIATTIDRTAGRAETTHKRTVRRLHELIAALDRRLPQVQRAGELAIARTAAALRDEALARIEQLEYEQAAAERPVAAADTGPKCCTERRSLSCSCIERVRLEP